MKEAILIATLNEAYYIGKCLESLKKQAYSVPIVVVDSNSTDDTVKIAKGYDVDVLQAPRGKLTAMDFAIRKLRPDIALLADADKWYPPNWTQRLLDAMTPETVLASGVIDVMDQSVFNPFFWVMPSLAITFATLGQCNGGNLALRTSAYEAIGGYDLSVNQKDFFSMWSEEEWLLPRRMQAAGRVTIEPSVIAYTSERRFQLAPMDAGFASKRGVTF